MFGHRTSEERGNHVRWDKAALPRLPTPLGFQTFDGLNTSEKADDAGVEAQIVLIPN